MLEPIGEVEFARDATRRSARELRQLFHVAWIAGAEEQELPVEREVVVVAEESSNPFWYVKRALMAKIGRSPAA